MRYELGFYMPEDSIPHSHRRENIKSYSLSPVSVHILHYPEYETNSLPITDSVKGIYYFQALKNNCCEDDYEQFSELSDIFKSAIFFQSFSLEK
jgi:hypothetical protein